MITKTILGTALLGLLTAASACGGEDTQAPPQTPAPTATASEPPPPPPVAAPAPKPTMLERQIAFEQAFMGSIDRPEKLAPLYAPDAVLWNLGDHPVKGRAAIQSELQDIASKYGDWKGADSRMWARGNVLVLQWVQTATHRASGKPVSLTGCEIFTFDEEGLVVTDHVYADYAVLFAQAGSYKGREPAPVLLSLPLPPVELHAAKNDATEETNAAHVAAASAALAKGDDRTYFGFFADDARWYDFTRNGVPPHDKRYDMAMTAAQRKAADLTAFKDVNVLAVEDFTIDEQEFSLTFKPARGRGAKKSVTGHGIEIQQWRDGKVVGSWDWTSAFEIDAQLGTASAAPKKKT